MIIYEYLFYGFYRLMLNTTYKDVAEYTAGAWLAIGTIINFAGALKILGFEPHGSLTPKVIAIILVVVLYTFNYYYFISLKKFKMIVERYDKYNLRNRKFNMYITVIFIIESISLPIVFALLEI
ncbi:MAG TPA: hypothetical protein VI583_04945 [Cyclobacteriaceae bacterium]|nr:hypothetical protein [Cyclobacteriaceae bacterium]